MDTGPTITERKALGYLLDALKQQGNNEKWHEYITSSFSDWQPIMNSGITLSQYYSSVKDFPLNGKRNIIAMALLGWNEHHDMQILYDCIATLIYLKICGVVEYFFLQEFFNFIEYFSTICKSIEHIKVTNWLNSSFTIIFDNPQESGLLRDVRFLLSRMNEVPALYIIPSHDLINAKLNIKGTYEDEGFLSSTISNTLAYIIYNEFVKRNHCTWIHSNFTAKFCNPPKESSVLIILDSLQYEDCNEGDLERIWFR